MSCKAITLAYGPDLASAVVNADGVLSALEQRYSHVVRTPKFANAQSRIGRYALAPSKLENDTSLWTGRSGSTGATRELMLDASMVNGQYTFVARAGVPAPQHIGDSRHIIRLSPLGEDEYQWSTDVDHNVGTMPASRATDVFTAMFASAERSAPALRADYHAAFPKTTQAVGRLFVLDSVTTVAQPDGSTLVNLQIFLDADRLRPTNPAMAKYVDKYVSSSKYQLKLSDNSGVEWLNINAVKGERVAIRFRSHNGVLQPILGAARAMPDTLQITIDALVKISLFTVGVTDMKGKFVHVHTPTDRGWLMRFQKEPDWHLPLVSRQLLRSPLRRPFEQNGILVRLGFRSTPGQATMLYRDFDIAVAESAIMRFIGNLGFTAMNDYAGTVEKEENRFLMEMFAAMRADVKALGSN
ncbi:MAG: hypothetical protein ABJC26_03480 [Gemmatimonadaceae bacterium]